MVVHIPGFQLPLTASSGQSFRFNPFQDDAYELIALSQRLIIRDIGQDLYDFSCDEKQFMAVWHRYFDLDRDYETLQSLVLQDGSFLHQAVTYASGVRILRQEPFENLISFIISQRKNIPAIKSCVEKLSQKFGNEICPGVHAFPAPEALAGASTQDLSSCGLGYRTQYVKQSAELVSSGEIDLGALHLLNNADLEQELLRFPGVGRKVAACVMLFAYQRMDSFPVDVWIKRVLDAEFPSGFPYDQYPDICGILQQYMFCYARHQAGRD
jgi:N-glycosylase/DNA lyase